MKKAIIGAIIVGITIFLMVFFLKFSNVFQGQNYLEISAQVRNISWNTAVSDSTPFRNGDTIDLVYFIKNIALKPQMVQYDVSHIHASMDVESIMLDDTVTFPLPKLKDTDGFFQDVNAESALHIIGKVKNDAEIKDTFLLF